MINLERQAITDTTRLPRRPGPHGVALRCTGQRGTRPCDNVLGVVDKGLLFVTDGAAQWISHLPASVRCDRCGRRSDIDAHGRLTAASHTV
jgi:hypothetical protein